MGKILDASEIVNYSINGVIFIGSISFLFLIYFYEKMNDNYLHIYFLFLIYNLYNFYINPFLGLTGLSVYIFLFYRYREVNYDLTNIEHITPIKFLFSKISKIDYFVIAFYYLVLISILWLC